MPKTKYKVGDHVLWANEENVIVKVKDNGEYNIWNIPDNMDIPDNMGYVSLDDLSLSLWDKPKSEWSKELKDHLGIDSFTVDAESEAVIVGEPTTVDDDSNYLFEMHEYVHVLYHGNGVISMQYLKDGVKWYRVQLVNTGAEAAFPQDQIEIYNPSEDTSGKELPKGAKLHSVDSTLPSHEDWTPSYGDKVTSKTGKDAMVMHYDDATDKVQVHYNTSYKKGWVGKKYLTLVALNSNEGGEPKDKSLFVMAIDPSKTVPVAESDYIDDVAHKFKVGDNVKYFSSNDKGGVVQGYDSTGQVVVEWDLYNGKQTISYKEDQLALDPDDTPTFEVGDHVRIGQSSIAYDWGLVGMEAVVGKTSTLVKYGSVTVMVKAEKYPGYSGSKGHGGKKGNLSAGFGLEAKSLTLLP